MIYVSISIVFFIIIKNYKIYVYMNVNKVYRKNSYIMSKINCYQFMPFYHIYECFISFMSNFQILYKKKNLEPIEFKHMSTQTEEEWDNVELPTSYGYCNNLVKIRVLY
jgi:hypothetical protein